MKIRDVFVTGVLVLVFSVPAGAVVLCAKPRKDGTFNSSVKIREICRDKETQLDPTDLGVQPSRLVLLDGLGNTLGQVVGRSTDLAPRVSFLDAGSGKTVLLEQSTDAAGVTTITPKHSVGVRFAGLACAGQVFLSGQSSGDTLDPLQMYISYTNPGFVPRFFAPDAPVAAGTMTFSDLDGDGNCDDKPGGVPLPGDRANCTATEATFSFPVPIAGPLEIVAEP